MLKQAGYATGLRRQVAPRPGHRQPRLERRDQARARCEIGFDYSFIIPATGDRVPCVYVENHRVVGPGPADPIQVSYGKPVGNEPTGARPPRAAQDASPSHGHDKTIVNGISRIGYMSGGKAARWKDEDMADTLTAQGRAFIEQNKDKPFFLYFATHDIHVPRVPHPRFAGKSECGLRGDVIQRVRLVRRARSWPRSTAWSSPTTRW